MKSKIQLLFDYKDYLYLILINLILLFIFIAFKKIWLIFLMLFCIYQTFKQNRKIGISVFVFALIILFQLAIFYQQNKKAEVIFNNEVVEEKAKIVNLCEANNYQKITFKINGLKYISYLYDEDCDERFRIGTKLIIKGVFEATQKPNLEYSFNYQNYLYNQKISGHFNINSYTIINNGKSPRNLQLIASKYYTKTFDEQTSGFLKALVIGDKASLSQDTKDAINAIGISHLFVVSGLHVSMIILVVNFFLTKLKIKAKLIDFIILAFLSGYLFLTNFLISVIRVFLSFTLNKANKYLQLNSFNLFSLNALIVMVIIPHQVFTYSFILSYLISGIIILSKKILLGKKPIIQMFLISFLSLLITLPIVAKINGSVNFLSVIYNLFYIPFVSYLLLPFSFLVSLFPFLAGIYTWIINLFCFITNNLKNIRFLTFIFPSIPSILIFFYYFILYLFLVRLEGKSAILKISFSLLLFMIMWNNKCYFNLHDEIAFLNIQVGDATLIQSAFNQMTILIDTGEEDEIVYYLKQRGIKRINYLIISHGDSDHMGQLTNILANIKVEQILISQYDGNTMNLLRTMKLPKKTNVAFLTSDFKTKLFRLQFISPLRDFGNTNDNSLVFILEIFKLKILFTGDISEKVEKEIVKKTNIVVNILKVAHHGSKTSSSMEFIKGINFGIAIAMNGSNNQFGFPHQAVISRFNNYRFYNTKDYGTIHFKKYFFQKSF